MNRARRILGLMTFVVMANALSAQAIMPVPEKREPESALRRGEIIFFISYPFTFLGSVLAYNLAGYAITAADGQSNFSGSGGGFYALSAATAAILSFGIAMNDYYYVKAQTRNVDGNANSYLSLSFRF